jgi:hypothetical protein
MNNEFFDDYDPEFTTFEFLRFRHSIGLFAGMDPNEDTEGLYQQVADLFANGDIESLKHLTAQGSWGFRDYGLNRMEAEFLRGIASSGLAILGVDQEEIDHWEHFSPSERPQTSVRPNKSYRSSKKIPPLKELRDQEEKSRHDSHRSMVHGDIGQRRSELRKLFSEFKDASTKMERWRIGRKFNDTVGEDIEIVDEVLGPMGLEISKVFHRAMAQEKNGTPLTADEEAVIELFGYLSPQ